MRRTTWSGTLPSPKPRPVVAHRWLRDPATLRRVLVALERL